MAMEIQANRESEPIGKELRRYEDLALAEQSGARDTFTSRASWPNSRTASGSSMPTMGEGRHRQARHSWHTVGNL